MQASKQPKIEHPCDRKPYCPCLRPNSFGGHTDFRCGFSRKLGVGQLSGEAAKRTEPKLFLYDQTSQEKQGKNNQNLERKLQENRWGSKRRSQGQLPLGLLPHKKPTPPMSAGSPPSPSSSLDRKSTRLNSSHSGESRMPSSA